MITQRSLRFPWLKSVFQWSQLFESAGSGEERCRVHYVVAQADLEMQMRTG
jgi:hypothetical protein